MVFFLEDDESAIAIVVELSHPRPVGLESIADDGFDEMAVGFMQKVQETVGGGEFAFGAGVFARGIGARLFVAYGFDAQHHVEHRT